MCVWVYNRPDPFALQGREVCWTCCMRLSDGRWWCAGLNVQIQSLPREHLVLPLLTFRAFILFASRHGDRSGKA
jgi:hypothetical protein